MQDQDRGAGEGDRNGICSLEWMIWAMEAAREHNEAGGSATYQLEYAHYYTDELIAL